MRTETVTRRFGEKVGEIDWAYDFMRHFACTQPNRREESCEKAKAVLKQIEDRFKAGLCTFSTTYGGWPRIGFHEVVDVGMYDGWPYWYPVPSVYVRGVLGCEWQHFNSITSILTE